MSDHTEQPPDTPESTVETPEATAVTLDDRVPAIRELLGNGTLLAMLIMCFAGLAIGYYVGGPEEDNRVVLALATAMRHPAVAITIGQAVGAGHFIQLEVPDQVNAMIERFLTIADLA